MTQDLTGNNYIPKDYEDMYRAYFAPGKLAPSLCKKLLFGKATQSWEDASQDAYIRLLRTDILTKFDTAKGNFGGMVYVACRSACCNLGKSQSDEKDDVSLVETTDERIQGTVAQDRTRTDEGQENRIVAHLGVEEIRKRAAEVKTKGRAKRFQKAEQLIDLLLEGHSKEEAAGILSVSRASIDLWIANLAKL